MSPNPFGIRGYLIDAPAYGSLRSHRDGAVVIAGGKIVEVGAYDDLRKRQRPEQIEWLDRTSAAIFPGLIDCHTHLPQYSAVARGESELLPWLRENVFPVEREFTGPKARREAPMFFQELARSGTTTAMVYAAIYEDSCDIGFEAAEQSGLRVILGKLMMDIASYGQSQPKKILSVSLIESERLCRKWHGAAEGRLEYAFSPRFAVTCSEKLMRSAGEMAQRFGAYLQTHLAENREEIEKVRHLHMTARDYTDVYQNCGLLTSKTMLGHCIHVNAREIDAIAASQANIAHCPTSNLFLSSGLMKLDQLLSAGIPIGLGSDVAAGPRAQHVAGNAKRSRGSEGAPYGGAESSPDAAERSVLPGDEWRCPGARKGRCDRLARRRKGSRPSRRRLGGASSLWQRGCAVKRPFHGRHSRPLHLSR
jgi:guanine deaminase